MLCGQKVGAGAWRKRRVGVGALAGCRPCAGARRWPTGQEAPSTCLRSPSLALSPSLPARLQGMAEAVTALLTEKGVPKERILTNF